MRASLLTSALVAIMHACGSSSPAPESTAPPPSDPSPTDPSHLTPTQEPAPVPSDTTHASEPASGDCQVAVRTRVNSLGGGRYELVATAVNTTDTPITTALIHACPGPAASFDGLREGYDYGDRCLAGACAEGAESRVALALAPGGSREVARVTIASTAGSCNPPLAEGAYTIGASIRLDGVRSCTTERAGLVLGRPAPVDPPATPSTRTTTPAREPVRPPTTMREERERCPAMGCAYTPCPPGVEPPTGCAAVCGCTGASSRDWHVAPE